MATLIPGVFNRYLLTEQEEVSGRVLNEMQRCVIQNTLADLAEERIALKFDPEHPQYFLQRDAELQGQIGILQLLLAESIRAVEYLANSSNQHGE